MGSDSRRRKGSHKEKKCSKGDSKSKKCRYSSLSSGDSSDSSEESRSSPDRSSRRKRRHRKDELQGELKKIKPHMFKGDSEKGEDADAWFLRMRKFFSIYDYSSKMEAGIAIHQL